MRDIMYKIDRIGEKIDIDVEGSGFNDLSKLIKFYRDAICHNDSDNRRNKKGFIFSHNIYAAYDFPDEMTILTGDFKLFLRRHLFLSYIKALQIFSSYEEFQTNEDFRILSESLRYYDVLEKPLQFRNNDL
jgi:hypothetical protein